MQVATFERKYDGSMGLTFVANLDRMTMDMFKSVYGGERALDQDAARCVNVPEGFMVWRTARGALMAIKAD
ncbi:hypothetical protein [Burkholderia sp. Bp9099]|uniref:hypothetical protein n=1 Tax=Burkholderia sp. Bp9099 TaxID=2184568 RepID=UPI000F60428B|nr:hypothetical protein [Burkholderia sp. Bp9099]RQZ40056.1 hypothetical protein DIE17_33200 [Burkholderia sp. Bp9099]